MHNQPDILGTVIHNMREKAAITVEELAEKVGVTPRYIYRIENEGKKPSYDVLFDLILELNIPSDMIFHSEKPADDSEITQMLRMLGRCDERSLTVVKATIQALLDTATEK